MNTVWQLFEQMSLFPQYFKNPYSTSENFTALQHPYSTSKSLNAPWKPLMHNKNLLNT